MSRLRREWFLALAVSLLLLSAGVGVGAAAAESAVGPSDAAADSGSIDGHAALGGSVARDAEPITQCFTGDGYPISIGETGATMETVVHLSVLTDPAAGNEFGIEAAGRLGDEPIVTLAAGVRLSGRQAFADGIDPFAAFDVLYTYDLRLPMFDGSIGDAGYEDSGSPIEPSNIGNRRS